MSLMDAISDLKTDVARGAEAETAVNAVAAEYGLNPKLVIRKFREAYPTDAGVRATVAITNPAAVFEAKLVQAVDELCKRYGVSKDRVSQTKFQDKTYTVIGRLNSYTALGVSHEDFRSYKLRYAH